MSDFQKTVTLGPFLEAKMGHLRTALRDNRNNCPAWLAGMDDTALCRLVMSLGIEAVQKENGLP